MIEVHMWTDGNTTFTQSLLVRRDGRFFFSKELDHNKRHIEVGSVGEIVTAHYYGLIKFKLVKI